VLTTDAYTAVFNETKNMGSAASLTRTDDGTQLALFWNGNTPAYWNRIAGTISAERHLTLSDNARLFALLNITMADAAIACWDAKYTYVFWRPITAITLADLDGNPDTDVDTSWIPLLQTVPPGITPNHPEYPSGHSTVSSSAATVLAAYFGDATPFSIDSEKLPGVLRSFPSFSQAVLEINNARVFGGIHFRTACLTGNAVGQAVANFIVSHAMLSVNGQRRGQISHAHGNGSVEGDGESSTEDSL
jgi:membrane-associated phospholipid phosphatase